MGDGEAPPTPAYLRAIALRCASVPKSLSARSRFGRGRRVYDVHEKNLGYDLMSLALNPGELRLIEGEGLGGAAGSVLLTPNEKRVAEDRRDCYWLYVGTDCKTEPKLQNPIKDPARLQWHGVKKVDHYWLKIEALTEPMKVSEESIPYED